MGPRAVSTDLATLVQPARVIAAALFWIALIAMSPVLAQGQGGTALTIDAWNAAAQTAEQTLASEGASDERLEELRSALIENRSKAKEALEPLRAQVTKLNTQLEAIGPAPEEGVSEPAEIATRRAELNASLDAARVPMVAVDAFVARASGIIDGIDELRRDRLSQALSHQGPMPFVPANITQALTEVRAAGAEVAQQSLSWMETAGRAADIRARLPMAAALLTLGLLLLLYVRRRILLPIGRRLKAAQTRGQRAFWSVSEGLAGTSLPIAASLAVIAGLREVAPDVPVLESLLNALLPAALVLIVAHWLGRSLFEPESPELAVLPGRAGMTRGRGPSLVLGLIAGLMQLLDGFASSAGLTQTAHSVLYLPLVLIGGVALYLLARQLRTAPGDEASGSLNLNIRVLGWLGFIAAFAAPLLALAGYFTASKALFLPYVYSFLLVGALLVIFWLVRELIESWLESGTSRAEIDFRTQFRLVPVLFGMLLAVIALPLLALIWGAQVSDVQSALTWASDGVTVGETQLSASDILIFILVFAFGYMATRAIQSVFRTSVLPRTSADIGARNAIVSGIGYVGIFLASLAAISSTGLSLSNLAIVAGALSIGVGFGLQTIVSNFVSGIILLIERPIKLGDWIEVSGYSGYVRRISVRATEIETFDRASVILPNADLVANPVLNWTHASLQARVIVPVGVAYGTDPRRVEALLLELGAQDERFLEAPAPSVVFQGFGADSLDFELRGVVRDANNLLSVRSDMNFAIAQRFEAEGIEIPYAQRDVALRNPMEVAEALATVLRKGEL